MQFFFHFTRPRRAETWASVVLKYFTRCAKTFERAVKADECCGSAGVKCKNVNTRVLYYYIDRPDDVTSFGGRKKIVQNVIKFYHFSSIYYYNNVIINNKNQTHYTFHAGNTV